MKKKLYIILLLLLVAACVNSQYLSNPSFEGPPGIGLSPDGWIPFNAYSTPDTEPTSCDYFLASDGETYMTLVTRGEKSTYKNTIENAQVQLLEPLYKDICYTFSIDLASRDDMGHYDSELGMIRYLSAIKLGIYASNSSASKGILVAETDEVTSQYWQTYSFSIKPAETINYLVLEVDHYNGSSGLGNLLLDNITINKEVVNSLVKLNETFQPSDLPIVLEASESDSYFWTPEVGLSCYDCQYPEVLADSNITYTCTFINNMGCPSEELFILRFEEEDLNPQEFNIPNVFTPNSDGYNDYFEIPGLPPYSSLIIFDRLGKKLFSSEQYYNDWNGKDMEGNELPEGTYWYVLITPGFSGKYKGFVYLKRD